MGAVTATSVTDQCPPLVDAGARSPLVRTTHELVLAGRSRGACVGERGGCHGEEVCIRSTRPTGSTDAHHTHCCSARRASRKRAQVYLIPADPTRGRTAYMMCCRRLYPRWSRRCTLEQHLCMY